MTPRISTDLLRGLLAQAHSAQEICGLLIGAEDRIVEYLSAPNVAADPARQFEIDPAILLPALRREREGGLRIAGWYHSHPNGSATPSANDAAVALPDGRLWLVLARRSAGLWRAVDGGERHGRFAPVAFDLIGASGLHATPAFSTRPGEPNIRSLAA